jgi:hypothetical protein
MSAKRTSSGSREAARAGRVDDVGQRQLRAIGARGARSEAAAAVDIKITFAPVRDRVLRARRIDVPLLRHRVSFEETR